MRKIAIALLIAFGVIVTAGLAAPDYFGGQSTFAKDDDR
jgi:hypothetical protein